MIESNSYKNPFINRNANTDSIDDIIKYWCYPSHIQLNEMLYSDKAIIIEGPRGCGKTTLFKYFSYTGQKLLGQNLRLIMEQGKYVCIYHRLGEYNYSALNGKSLGDKFWENLFMHIFELKLSLMLMNTINMFMNDDESINRVGSRMVSELSKIRGFNGVENVSEFIVKLEEYINEVNDFTRKRSMMEIQFEPKYWFSYYDIVEKIISVFNKHITGNFKLKIAFAIDEMENLSFAHQKVINTYIKFVKENITFRLGTRPSGILTYETLTSEGNRENHDFSYVEINPYINTNKYEKFLIEIANKRLSISVYSEKNDVKIENLLGRKENIITEIKERIPEDFNKHFELLKSTLPEEKLELIRSDDKLQELLNIIKYNRGEELLSINAQMNAYNLKTEKDSKEYKKYVNAYQNKYKKSLAYLLLHLADKNKLYYSIKTFTHLSSGSTRIFLQLCHKVFELASFYSPECFYENDLIDPELQSKAALKVAESEMIYLKRVSPHGKEIFNFIDNVCRLFRYYHIDIELKYPETNQFTLDDEISESNMQIIDIARMHAFIIRKRKLQQRSIGLPKTHIFTINRIYFPLYNISCVTRGGFNPKISNLIMNNLIRSQIGNSLSIAKLFENIKTHDYKQIEIEDWL